MSNDDFEFTLPEENTFNFEEEGTAPVAEEESKSEDPPEEDSESAQEEQEEDTPEFSKEELLQVFDQILFEGTYVERGSVRNRLPYEFRMRTTKDVSEIARNIDKASFNMMATIEQHVAVLNLSYSLVSYKGTDLSNMRPLPNPSKKGEKSRYDFINELPSSVTSILYNKLSKFDRKVHMAMVEAEENF